MKIPTQVQINGSSVILKIQTRVFAGEISVSTQVTEAKRPFVTIPGMEQAVANGDVISLELSGNEVSPTKDEITRTHLDETSNQTDGTESAYESRRVLIRAMTLIGYETEEAQKHVDNVSGKASWSEEQIAQAALDQIADEAVDGYLFYPETCRRIILTALRQNQAARDDTERLNWLDRMFSGSSVLANREILGTAEWTDFRTAIDAARKETGK